MGNILKRLEPLFSFVGKNFWLLLAVSSAFYFFFATKTHAGLTLEKPEIYGLGFILVFIFGVSMYFVGHGRAHIEMRKERDEHAQMCYGWGKSAFERKDYIEAIAQSAEAVGATSGLQGVMDCSSERHLLAASLERVHHDSAAEAHDYAAFYASDDNPDKALYYFYSSVAHLNNKNWELASLRAQIGLHFIANHPWARYGKAQPEYDLGSELRMLRMLSAMMGGTGSKAFESCREDAAWIVANSKDKEKVRYAERYLAAPAALNTVADQVMKDYLREGAAGN